MSAPPSRKIVALFAACLFALSACSESEQKTTAKAPASPAESAQPLPATPPAQSAQAPAHPNIAPPMAHPGHAGNTGKVLNIAQAGPYTYVEVDQNGRSVWLAGNRVNVAVGDQVHWGNYAVMRNFTSKSLNRVFDEILFVSSIQPAGAGTTPAANTAGGGPTGTVMAVMNAAGYTYIEVETDGRKKWLAAPQSHISVGDRIAWQGGNTMMNFTSKSLNRSFDTIDFVASVTVKP